MNNQKKCSILQQVITNKISHHRKKIIKKIKNNFLKKKIINKKTTSNPNLQLCLDKEKKKQISLKHKELKIHHLKEFYLDPKEMKLQA